MTDTASLKSQTWLSPSAALSRFKAKPILTSVNVDSQELLLGQRPARFGFRLGSYGLLLGAQVTSEVLEPLTVYRVPNTSAEWLGLVNLRGNLVPVYDLSAILGWPRDESVKSMMLFLGQGQEMLGIKIDGLPQVPTLDQPLHRLPALPKNLQAYADQAYIDQGITWVEFDYKGFFRNYIEHLTSPSS